MGHVALPDTPAPSLTRSSVFVVPQPKHRPGVLEAPRLVKAPTIEDFITGKPTDEALAMQSVSSFIQRDPDEGAPVTEPTTAYLGYTRRNLYIAFICRDHSPSEIRAHMLPRDNLGDDDKVEVTLDTFHDQRRALVFQSNPLGIQADASYSEQTGKDFSFDTVWDTWGKREPFGYVVLMRIPFQSLRFKDSGLGTQTWGIVLRRWIAHDSERAFWPRISRQIAGLLTQDAPVEGFANVERGHNMQFIPYSLGQSYRRLDDRNPLNPYFDSKHLQGTAGLDSKIVIHDSLVLDTTLNPDFSQVNINDPASPNQRFQPYFQEQRPFFIENSSYFSTPINLFYTLNIASPELGARLSGKQGPWAIGILATDDRSPGLAAAPGSPDYNTRAHFYVARVAHDLGRFSTAGLIYTDREYLNSFNRLGGFDYRWRFKHKWTLTGQAVSSATQNTDNSTQSGNTYKQNLNFSGRNFYFSTTYDDTGKGFLDEVGFFRRPDDRKAHIHTGYTWRPDGKLLLAYGPSFYTEQDWDHTGLPLDSIANLSYYLQFNGNTKFYSFLNVSNDRLRPADYSTLTQNVEYRSQTAGLNLYTSPIPEFVLNLAGYAGQTVNYNPPANTPPQPVNVQSVNMNLDLKPLTDLDLQNRYEFDRFRDPGRALIAYDNHLVVERWNLQVNKALSVRLIGVYQATLPNALYSSLQNTKDIYGDALITYMPHPGTALYLGYTTDAQNLNRTLCTRLPNGSCDPNGTLLPRTDSSLLNDSRTFYLKLSYLLRF
ncbi:MAG: carbohydrate binding family 9 domain-containing protein [Acidobacteriaceae bacterium]